MPDGAEAVKVKEVMTKEVVTIGQEATIQEAAEIMKKRGIRGLIVTSGGAIEGVLTDRDIVEKVVAQNRDPAKTKVSAVMVPRNKIITASPDDDLVAVGKKMRAFRVGRVPIVDNKNRLTGIVTETDMTRVYPGLVEVLYEALEEKPGTPSSTDKRLMAGKCERCGNYSEFLVEMEDGDWLCENCSAEYTGEYQK